MTPRLFLPATDEANKLIYFVVKNIFNIFLAYQSNSQSIVQVVEDKLSIYGAISAQVSINGPI